MTGSTLVRGEQIERDFFHLKAQEFGPLATEIEIRAEVETALRNMWVRREGRSR